MYEAGNELCGYCERNIPDRRGFTVNDRIAESAQLASEYVTLIESVADPMMTVALAPGAMQATLQAGAEVETLRLARRVIELAAGDATMGNLVIGSPLSLSLAFCGFAETLLGQPGFTERFDSAIAAARPVDLTCFATSVMYKHCCITLGAILVDDAAVQDADEAFTVAEHSGDKLAYGCGLLAKGIALFHRGGPDTDAGCELLATVRELGLSFHRSFVRIADVHFAARRLQTGDVDGAIDLARALIDALTASGDGIWLGQATTILVEALLQRGTDSDVDEAETAIDQLAATRVDPGYVMYEIPTLRMRALLARARGDESGYREYTDRYRARATEVGFAGHMVLAEAMTRDV